MEELTPPLLDNSIPLSHPSGQPDSQRPSEKLFGAVGSSILLPGFNKADFKNVEHVKWMFSGTRILDYYSVTEIPTFTNLYKSRTTFFSSNGSLLLKDIARSDSGLYKVQINLNVTKVFQLSVLVALSEPLISNNSTGLGTTIALVCRVDAGFPDSFVWWKDSTVIANGEHSQFLKGNSTLVITAAKKSDCGDYICMVENAVSRKNVSHRLLIYGLPHLIHSTMVLSIIALVFAVSVFFGIMFLCFRLDTERIEIKFHGKALRCLHVASMLSLITLLAAFICWILFEGYCEITIFMVVLLCVLLILTIFSTCSMVTWDSKRFNKILRYRICRVTVDAVTPVCGLVVVCASAILLAEIAKLTDRKQRRTQQLRGSAEEPTKENPDQPVGPEQVPLQAVSEENGLNTRHCEEEPHQT
ncbi:hepatocyte cell adhesion molecule-like isoform X2 [Chiloscyllium plagiosum]|uniref:hepatocyte cell adhesion molecule-like isoform X2 n=1 Tax=Chiloscyllium plagiosum TaxID=36176 RepID=UPI001CB818E4|nr:hepatocyte cell adhesion molecule-like isoform X2 [Chiloscyllium plagiosum]